MLVVEADIDVSTMQRQIVEECGHAARATTIVELPRSLQRIKALRFAIDSIGVTPMPPPINTDIGALSSSEKRLRGGE